MERDELERQFGSSRPASAAAQALASSEHDETVLAAARAAASRIRARRRSASRWSVLVAFAAGVLLGVWMPGRPWRQQASPGAAAARRPLDAAAAPAGPERVAFPPYHDDVHYLTRDRPDIKQVRDIYASAEAVRAAKAGQPLPWGTVLTIVLFKAKVDATGGLVRDRNGRLVKGELDGIGVMEKRKGWGAEYTERVRNGEWEYAQFMPDGARNEKADIEACLECHKRKDGQDFVFTFAELARGWR